MEAWKPLRLPRKRRPTERSRSAPSIVDRDGRIIGRGRNRRESGDPLGHAEIYRDRAKRRERSATGGWKGRRWS